MSHKIANESFRAGRCASVNPGREQEAALARPKERGRGSAHTAKRGQASSASENINSNINNINGA